MLRGRQLLLGCSIMTRTMHLSSRLNSGKKCSSVGTKQSMMLSCMVPPDGVRETLPRKLCAAVPSNEHLSGIAPMVGDAQAKLPSGQVNEINPCLFICGVSPPRETLIFSSTGGYESGVNMNKLQNRSRLPDLSRLTGGGLRNARGPHLDPARCSAAGNQRRSARVERPAVGFSLRPEPLTVTLGIKPSSGTGHPGVH